MITPHNQADVCDTDPGFDVSVTVRATLRSMTQIWRGDRGWADALRAGAVELYGPTAMRRAFPGWFTLSDFATVPRPEHSPSTA